MVIKDISFSCDVHVVALRTLSQPTVYFKNDQYTTIRETLPDKSAALILHRFGFNCNKDEHIEYRNMSCRNSFGEVFFNLIYEN